MCGNAPFVQKSVKDKRESERAMFFDARLSRRRADEECLAVSGRMVFKEIAII